MALVTIIGKDPSREIICKLWFVGSKATTTIWFSICRIRTFTIGIIQCLVVIFYSKQKPVADPSKFHRILKCCANKQFSLLLFCNYQLDRKADVYNICFMKYFRYFEIDNCKQYQRPWNFIHYLVEENSCNQKITYLSKLIKTNSMYLGFGTKIWLSEPKHLTALGQLQAQFLLRSYACFLWNIFVFGWRGFRITFTDQLTSLKKGTSSCEFTICM